MTCIAYANQSYRQSLTSKTSSGVHENLKAVKRVNGCKTKSSIFFVLLTIIFLSACVSRTVRVDANSGLAINKFFADPERVDSGDIVTVYMEIENVGERTARSVLLELISSAFEGQTAEPQKNCIDEKGRLIVCPLNIQLPQVVATRTERNYYFDSLAPPKPVYNQPGDFRVVSWALQAPYVPEGVVKDFRLLGKLTYEYSTSAAINMPVYTKNEIRQRKDVKSVETTSTNGPIKIDVSGPNQIVVNTDPDIININKNEIVVYTITLSNTGDGIPFTNYVNGLVKGSVRFSGGITPVDCLASGKTYEIIPASPVSRSTQQTYESGTYQVNLPDSLVLRNGESVTFSCTLGLARDQWISRPFGTATIAFDLSYLYFIEKEAVVTVRGVRV